MLSAIVCIALFVVMAYFAFACLYEVCLWVSHRLTDIRQERRMSHRQRMFTPV
jgi:hypothetical protein